jgi:hypothetical protein
VPPLPGNDEWAIGISSTSSLRTADTKIYLNVSAISTDRVIDPAADIVRVTIDP